MRSLQLVKKVINVISPFFVSKSRKLG